MSYPLPDEHWPVAVIEELAKSCHCKASVKPCDGVLCGGICDDIQEEPEPEDDEDEDQSDYLIR